jgi:hypothetical protein
MKNKILYLIMIIGVIQLNTSCKKSFLEVSPKGIQLESNYYQSADQAYAGLVATYNPLAWEAGGGDNTYISDLGALNSASDECYAGGGGPTDMSTWQAVSNYSLLDATTGPQGGFWSKYYTIIYRSNLLLQKINTGIPGLTDANKARYIAECKFLRGYSYFGLVRLFKNVPLFTTPVASGDFYNVVQAKPEDVYAQVEKDLKDAAAGLPSVVPSSENGRVTKGAAQALLGKAILYQNGTPARMKEAADLLELVNTSPNYGLLTDFAAIFSPDNKFNKESIFEIYHTGTQNAGWGTWPNFQANIYTQMIGPRSYTGPTYWSGGWSFNPMIAAFAATMKTDPRYKYTVANIDSITKATGKAYVLGYQNTGFFINKFAPLAKYVSTTGQAELNFPNDYIEIRLADTYLLEAEALVRSGTTGKAQFYLDAVRARVGLPSIPATLDNIYNERKFELATEGHRWYDLVRTGKAATVLAFKNFTAGKNELLPIPIKELYNTKLVQNPNYH